MKPVQCTLFACSRLSFLTFYGRIPYCLATQYWLTIIWNPKFDILHLKTRQSVVDYTYSDTPNPRVLDLPRTRVFNDRRVCGKNARTTKSLAGHGHHTGLFWLTGAQPGGAPS